MAEAVCKYCFFALLLFILFLCLFLNDFLLTVTFLHCGINEIHLSSCLLCDTELVFLPTLDFSTAMSNRISCFAGEAFDPTFFLSCTVSNVICCLVFGQRFSYDNEQFLSLLRIISEAIQFGSNASGQVRCENGP